MIECSICAAYAGKIIIAAVMNDVIFLAGVEHRELG